MIVGSQLFKSYLECPTKCWLHSRSEPRGPNHYAEWASAHNETYFQSGLNRLLAQFSQSERAISPSIPMSPGEEGWRVASGINWTVNRLASCLQAVVKIPANGRGRHDLFVPYRFEPDNKIRKEHKLHLAFDALVLSGSIGREVSIGKLVHGDKYVTLNVKTLPLAREVRKRIKDIIALLGSNVPPDLVLNRHCSQCEFQTRCRAQAIEKDELTLLSGLTQAERKRLHGRGIFTVTQLSYTFRPRRRRRASRGREEKHHQSLQALAIREKKIHAVGVPDPKLEGTPVFLDVEGVPDLDFYYLIGIRVQTRDGCDQHSFWATDEQEESLIWSSFLRVLSETANPHLIYYGSYETKFLKRMCERYGRPPAGSQAAAAIDHSTNLLSLIYARIYFPTYSNGLKEVTKYLGFKWSGPLATGLETIAWRHLWEVSRDATLKDALLNYNRQDCEALELLAYKLIDLNIAALHENGSFSGEVVLAAEIKQTNSYLFKRNEFAICDMEIINNAAYWDYQRERVYVKSLNKSVIRSSKHSAARHTLKPNKTIEYSRPSSCASCKSQLIYMHGKKSRIVIDLRFMQHGIKRWVTRYVARRYRCPSCGSIIHPHDRQKLNSRYGPSLVAYTIYQIIELGLSQNRVAHSIKELFGIDISRGGINRFKAAGAIAYDSAYNRILKKLCSGHLLHVDETSAGVTGREGYVWVLTSLEDVAYLYTPTRSGEVIQGMLRDFSGVLVTDFYAVYDAVQCPQQKCLIHFIRDLNEELLKHPYDDELKQVAGAFAGLVKPMIETVDLRGLRKRFLGKHRISVDRFYEGITVGSYESEPARKILERLQKSRDTMFTFLKFDDVPWNNNNAEHAIKAFASLRRVFGGITTEKGLREFLILLSICQTCKYKNVSFLDFLRSDAEDVDSFMSSGRRGTALIPSFRKCHE